VPSHGLHTHGQTYAIDLVYEPAPKTRPRFGGWHPVRDPADYPAEGWRRIDRAVEETLARCAEALPRPGVQR
jgi:hypothetical protein